MPFTYLYIFLLDRGEQIDNNYDSRGKAYQLGHGTLLFGFIAKRA